MLYIQESFADESTTAFGMASGQTLNLVEGAGSSGRSNGRAQSTASLEDVLSLTFRLMRVQGLPSRANTSSVTIQDLIQVWCEIFGGSYMPATQQQSLFVPSKLA
jgi:tyrosyl-DNA phosphodiesterase 1